MTLISMDELKRDFYHLTNPGIELEKILHTDCHGASEAAKVSLSSGATTGHLPCAMELNICHCERREDRCFTCCYYHY